jgi:type II secretory pathway component PulF
LALEVSEPSGETQTDSFTTLDYIRELYLLAEEQKKSDRKKIRLLRAGVALIAVTMAAVILSAVLVVPALLNTANEASKTLAIVQQIDVETIASDMDALAVQASDTFLQVGDAVKVLDDLDMETLNETIGKLETAVESFSKLDVATLNKAIANLNATVEPLARLFGKK